MNRKWIETAFLVLLANAFYLWTSSSPTLFYMSNVVLHVLLGIVVFLGLRLTGPPRWLAAASVACAVWLAAAGNTYALRPVLWAHIATAVACATWLLVHFKWWRAGAAAVVIGCLPALFTALTEKPRRIVNPELAPLTMEGEGGGPKSPFWPSSAVTNTKGIIPSDFFLESEQCGSCHKDIYEQWKSSVHHFGSFNNQFYRKSIEYMQETAGVQGTKWCAGCHDHAVFFNGRFEKPIKDQIDTPEAQAGLACVSCHSISHVGSSMGNGDFTMEYPPLHELAASKNPVIQAADRFLTYLNPKPHRATFLKPFHREDASEFCSACHKVHLDVPVNSYRWFRGFNEYDNWQASGVSGQGARSFYYPAKSSTCNDCHMPLVDSKDPGNRNGKVHSHRFATANTAVAFVNRDEKQLKETVDFLKSGFVTVDIFAASPVEENKNDTAMVRRAGDAPQTMSTFAVGEEAEASQQVTIREVGKMAAPIDQAGVAFPPGSTVRVDVVVRTRKVGHFFPGGTVDSFDVWLELQGKDADGRVVYWSGNVEDGGRGPVEPGAHFYRSYQLDGEGNPINKRNAFETRSVLYVRLIPPGAADVAHYRVRIPKDAKGPITLAARLNYRKFTHYYTQFSYAGKRAPGSNEFTFEKTNIPANVSGQIRGEVPVLPVVTLAQTETKLAVGPAGSEPSWQVKIRKEDRERWNDWGIGLLLQGDLKAAEYAFHRVTEAEPEYADGWLNVARSLVQEGETDRAKPFVEKAQKLGPNLGRVYFFRAMVEKADGEYDGALASLRKTESLYPRDRVVLNQIARILFLKRDYNGALEALRRVAAVDPEDLQMHYTAMLCYRGLGDAAKASAHETLFRRFKAEESSQAITQKRRQISPEDNNERQSIHDHESARLPGGR